jgi:DsbC/DsbD-like thiol-disulfide interchange protein
MLLVLYVLLLSLLPNPQSLIPEGKAPQHVDVLTGAMVAGRVVTLWVDVAPKPGMHVYARGAKGFDAVKLTVVPQAGVAVRPAKYPVAEAMPSPGTLERVPVYGKTFRITQPLTLAKDMKGGNAMAVTGALTYQACDDRLCYPTQTMPIMWSLVVGR